MSLARSCGVKLVVCESMTGGLLSSSLTEPSGASEVFSFGLVVYSGLSKSSFLGVPQSLLSSKGEVSAEVASSMLSGLLSRASALGLSSDGSRVLGLALTGNAGRDDFFNAGPPTSPTPPAPPTSSVSSSAGVSDKVSRRDRDEVGLLYLAAGFSSCSKASFSAGFSAGFSDGAEHQEHHLSLQTRNALRQVAAHTSLQLLFRLLETIKD